MPLLVHTVWRRNWALKIPTYVASSGGSSALPVALSMGGDTAAAGSGTNSVSKYNTSNDTVTAGTNLLQTRVGMGAVSCVANAISMDGANPSALTSTEKYTYSGDTVATGAALAGTSRSHTANVSTTSYGLLLGGAVTDNGNTVTAALANVDQYTFSSDTDAAQTALGTAVTGAAGLNTGSAALVAGGNTGTSTANDVYTTQKYDLSAHTTTAGANLAAAARDRGAYGNTTTGWIAGGITGSSSIAGVDKYTFSGDTVAAGAALAAAASYMAASGCATFGLLMGGWGTSSRLTTIDKRTFSSDTSTQPVALGTAVENNVGTGPQINGLQATSGGSMGAGGGPFTGGTAYFTPGTDGNNRNLVRYQLATDTLTTDGPAINTPSGLYGIGAYCSPNDGYMENGYAGSAAVNQSLKYALSSNTLVTAGAVMGPAGDDQAGLMNPTYGYLVGSGNQIADTNSKNTFQRTFSSDAVANWTALSVVRDQWPPAFGINGVGYVAGGDSNAAQSTYVVSTDKFTYSSGALSTGGSLPSGIGSQQAFGNTTEAVVAGGYNGSSYTLATEVYTYSSDTFAAGTALAQVQSNTGAGSNSNVGLMLAGLQNGTTALTSSQKYTFSSGAWTAGASLTTGTQVNTGFGPTVGGLQ